MVDSETTKQRAMGPQIAERDESAEARALRHRVLLHLILVSLVPLLILAVFFNYQYCRLTRLGDDVRLRASAERRAVRLDQLFSAVWLELLTVGDESSPSTTTLRQQLERLRRSQEPVVAIGIVDGAGTTIARAGDRTALAGEDQREAPWFRELLRGDRQRVIHQVQLGSPAAGGSFIIVALRCRSDGAVRVIWAALASARVWTVIASPGEQAGLRWAVVDDEGRYRLVDHQVARLVEPSPFHPPAGGAGVATPTGQESGQRFGYAWLQSVPAAVIVHGQPSAGPQELVALNRNVLIVTVLLLAFGLLAAWFNARFSVRRRRAAPATEQELSGQLVRAARLASVGELATGIAHEINNPLAIIAEEVGLLKDLMDPELGGELSEEELTEHLDIIHDAVFRGRDITRKLLGCVRNTEVTLEPHDIHAIIEEVVEAYLGQEHELSQVVINREYSEEAVLVLTDRSQLSQVLLNLMTNAVDAMGGSGELTLRTTVTAEQFKISVADRGCGMDREQLQRIFMPFYTTKDPGKGTGLGLAVSRGIVESLGGELYVDSTVCEGSTFTIELPIIKDPILD